MSKLQVFDTISLDGYFTDANNSERFAHEGADDKEFGEFTKKNASGGGALLMGRKNYDVMIQFWPTPGAMDQMPDVAKGMNAMQKYVVSKSFRDPTWQNTQVLSGDLKSEVERLKRESPTTITILGSGSVIAQLTEWGLIDEYQIVVTPMILGGGRPLFEGVKRRPTLELVETRAFKNGRTFSRYRAA